MCEVQGDSMDNLTLSWNPSFTCIPSCPPPPAVSHGYWNISSGGNANANGVYSVNTTIVYTCLDGWTMNGPNEVQCRANTSGILHWRGNIPVCNLATISPEVTSETTLETSQSTAAFEVTRPQRMTTTTTTTAITSSIRTTKSGPAIQITPMVNTDLQILN